MGKWPWELDLYSAPRRPARPGEDEDADLYQRGFLDGFQEAKGTGDEAAAAYARRDGERVETDTETEAVASSATAEEDVVASPPTEPNDETATESVVVATPRARLTPGEGRGHEGALDVVKIVLDPETVERLDEVDAEPEDEDATGSEHKSRAARMPAR